MEFSVKSGSPEKQRISCVAVGVFESRKLSHSAQILDEASDGYIANLIRRGECEGKLGQTLLLHNVPNTLCDRVLLIGCGREKNFDTGSFQKTNNMVAKFLDERGATEVFSCLTELPIKSRDIAWKVSQAVQATEDALYSFDQLKTVKESTRRPLRKIIFSVPSRRELPDSEQAVRNGMAIASGMTLAKDLANLP
ncbi:MAG: leucyl aminopeptidase, partial [Gammaproteobacteria bacterium]|nr:leucyl aminopeptidase [Gammaproteobacteria bacterium]